MNKTDGIVIFLVILWCLPLLIIISTLLRPQSAIVLHGFKVIPEEVTLINLLNAWDKLKGYVINSIIITLSVTSIIFIGGLAAYPISKIRIRFAVPLVIFFLAGNMIPPQLLIIPLWSLEDKLGILNTYQGIVLARLGFEFGFAVFFMRNFIVTIPKEYTEAARIEGASEFQIFWKIYLPLIKPAVLTLFLFEFIWSWNEYLYAFVLTTFKNVAPITVGLAQMAAGLRILPWGEIMGGVLISAIPAVLVFTFLKNYLIRGFMARI